MNKTIIFVLVSLFTSICFANTIVNNTIKLPKEFKVLNTFSGEISDTKSFHLILSKNRKNNNYSIHSYTFENSTIKELKVIENDQLYSVVSFHKEKNILTILFSYTKKGKEYLQKVNINFITNTFSKEKATSHKNFEASFKEKNRSVLLYKHKNELICEQYIGSDKKINSKYNFEKYNDKIKVILRDEAVSTINTDEYVKNGSVNSLNAYLKNDQIYFTKYNKYKKTTSVLKINIKDSILKPLVIDIKNYNKVKLFKKNRSFFYGNKLFYLGLNKKEGVIKITDITNKKTLNTILIDSSLNSKIKGNESFEGIEKFLKNAGKNKYIPTITVNKAVHNTLIIRVDYVDQTYSYNNNWWFFNQQMQFHNQMLRAPGGFGPNSQMEYYFNNATTNKENRFFEMLVDQNGILLDKELTKTVYKQIDKKKHREKLKETIDISKESSCFLKNSFRYIGYSKKLKEFVIQTNTLK